MGISVKQKIDRIMGDAYDKAVLVLDEEVRKLLRAKPNRYSRYVHAVGWGPTMFDPRGKLVDEDAMCAHGKRVMALANDFYDRFGGDNHQVTV